MRYILLSLLNCSLSYLFSPWLRSISSSPSIPNFPFVTFYTFSSRMSKVSFCSPSIPLIRISILRNDLTIPSIYLLHSQYLTHHLVIFVISVFIWFESDFVCNFFLNFFLHKFKTCEWAQELFRNFIKSWFLSETLRFPCISFHVLFIFWAKIFFVDVFKANAVLVLVVQPH